MLNVSSLVELPTVLAMTGVEIMMKVCVLVFRKPLWGRGGERGGQLAGGKSMWSVVEKGLGIQKFGSQ